MLAGKLFQIPIKGTHAHAFVTSFTGLEEVRCQNLPYLGEGDPPSKVKKNTVLPSFFIFNSSVHLRVQDFLSLCVEWRDKLGEFLSILASEAHDGELAAFVSYALAFPKTFVALIDTYDVSK